MSKVNAHESIVMHAFCRLGGYLRILGYTSTYSAPLFCLVALFGLLVVNGIVLPACLTLGLWCLLRFQVLLRRNPRFVLQALEVCCLLLAVSRGL